MPRYFQNMPVVGKPRSAPTAENVAELKAIEEEIHAQIVKGLENGKADADMNAKGTSPPCSGVPAGGTPAPGAP